jgi:recombination protein RecR
MNSHFEKLHAYFKSFPGTGKRQAERFVYHILSQDSVWVESLVREIQGIKKSISECDSCFYIYKKNGLNECEFCTSKTRQKNILAVVEKSSDIEILSQKTNFKGNFFVLGGQIPVIEKRKNPKQVRISELLIKIEKLLKKEDEMDFSLEKKDFEVIICTSYNADGIFTASVIKEKIREKFGKDIIITTFGRGFSSGTELEYADSETLRYALENKTYL